MSILQQLKSNVVSFKSGTVVISENDESRKMFIIGKGQVRVFKNYLGRKITLAILGQGEIFGELSFLDGAPRSASVEAVTDVALVVIDGDITSKEMATLPKWVMPVMRAICNRFREADHRLTLLQSVYEFQKNHKQKDKLAETIYCELLRYVRALKVLYDRTMKEGRVLRSKEMMDEMDNLLGKSIIPLHTFWKVLREHDFLNVQKEESEGLFILNEPNLNDFNLYLEEQAKSDHYLILGHPALNILKRLLLQLNSSEKVQTVIDVSQESEQISSLPFYQEGMNELCKEKIVEKQPLQDDKYKLNIVYETISRIYGYQSIIKSFDHTMVNLN